MCKDNKVLQDLGFGNGPQFKDVRLNIKMSTYFLFFVFRERNILQVFIKRNFLFYLFIFIYYFCFGWNDRRELGIGLNLFYLLGEN